MNEERNNMDNRLEGLLRRWGADEAAQQMTVGSTKLPLPHRRRAPSLVLRWLPLAAAVLLFVSSAALFIASRKQEEKELGLANMTISSLQNDLEQLSAKFDETLAALNETQRRLDEEDKKFKDELARLTTENAGLTAPLERQIAALSATLSEKENLLKTTTDKLSEQEALLVKIQEDLNKSDQRFRRLNDQFAAEMKRLQAAGDAAVAAQHEAEDRLKEIRAQQAALLGIVQRVYLARTTSPEERLRTVQQAARDARLVQRCAELRPAVRKDATTKILDTLEVLLTRLDLLDTYDKAEVEAFAALLDSTNLLRQIQEVVVAGEEDPGASALLVEAQLLLMEVQRAI